ncbi:tail assembly protein [Oceanisphaera sediminis]|uniref:Tail assembly protein n=1 Tax=Oceanisphaera sediminis TaxID=981381 RepID=A0ABP7DHJ8_9GAMM
MATVRLYGDLKRFGREFVFDVSTVGEIFRALCSQLPGFRQAMTPHHYRVRVGKGYLQADQLQQGMSQAAGPDEVIHIVPVASGAKSGWGIFGVVAGAVLVVAGLVTGQLWLTGLGVTLMVGGAAMMLTQTPQMMDNNKGNEAESSRNTSFSNVSNMLPQGRPVPLAYGEIYTGSLVISQGLYSE